MILSSVYQPENSSETFQRETRKDGGGQRTRWEINHKADFWTFENLPSEFSSEDIFPAGLPLHFLQFLNTVVLYVQVAVNTPDVTFKCNKLLLMFAWPKDRIKASSNVCIKKKKKKRRASVSSVVPLPWACFHSWHAGGSIVSQYLEKKPESNQLLLGEGHKGEEGEKTGQEVKLDWQNKIVENPFCMLNLLKEKGKYIKTTPTEEKPNLINTPRLRYWVTPQLFFFHPPWIVLLLVSSDPCSNVSYSHPLSFSSTLVLPVPLFPIPPAPPLRSLNLST